jgi:hypothetical protein
MRRFRLPGQRQTPGAKGQLVANSKTRSQPAGRVPPDVETVPAPQHRSFAQRYRWPLFALICVVAITATVLSVVHGHSKSLPAAVEGGPAVRSTLAQGLDKVPDVLFRSTVLDHHFGTVGLVPLGDTSGARALTSLSCDRVDFAGGRGLCLTSSGTSIISGAKALIFDSQFHVLRTVQLAGLPSRTRVSPDGHWGAYTIFVNGDTYATMGFSTRTGIINMQTGATVLNLEKLHVTRNGKTFQAVDFNFWGVTFANDNRHFYATLGTGGQTDLIEGDLTTGQATVLRTGVECPSLSPDNRQIAFKKRLPGSVVTWRLSVLDLSNPQVDHPLAETHSVDDQVEWLDNNTVMYAMPTSASAAQSVSAGTPGVPAMSTGASIATDTYTVPADGSGTPKLFMQGTWSAVVVHP